jgi:glucose/arabinose dehydrogenase
MKTMKHLRAYVLAGMTGFALSGCYTLLPSEGGGQTDFSPPRQVDASDVALPADYKISVVSTGFTFPTSVTFDEAGNPYVVEAGYSYGEVFTVPRLLKVNPDGSHQEVFRGGRNGPWTGASYSRGHFYIAEGGELEGGRILRVAPDGKVTLLVGNLPSLGDHHTNGPVIGPDGKIYFGQGTATNSGVVGVDNAKFGWLKRFPDFHDVPCKDIILTGVNFETQNALKPGTDDRVVTGAYSPYGTATTPGQVIKGQLPCGGAVMRINPDGSQLELVAWGFRNPFGLAFSPAGQLYLTENGYDVRGSRPVWGAADVLWRVIPGTWYGWPEFSGGQPLEGEGFKPPGEPIPPRLLHHYPGTPPSPVARLGVHASANGFDFSRSTAFGHAGQAFIAEFGDMAPDVGKVMHPVGYRVVRVNVENGQIEHFAVNKGKHNGPASKLGTGGLERPVAARFNPSGDALYVVDFGVMTMGPKGPQPRPGTGVLWKISRQGE